MATARIVEKISTGFGNDAKEILQKGRWCGLSDCAGRVVAGGQGFASEVRAGGANETVSRSSGIVAGNHKNGQVEWLICLSGSKCRQGAYSL